MLILSTIDPHWMRQCDAALLAEGIPSRWLTGGESRVSTLEVPRGVQDRAVAALSEQFGEELRFPQAEDPPGPWVPLLLQPPFALALGMALLLLTFFWVSGSAVAHSSWFATGALIRDQVLAGQWWRLVTAACLHADLEHAMSNAGFFVVLGWAAGERLGFGLSLWLWLLSAVLGFVASLLFSPETWVTVGASGGLFGLLGAAGGHGFKSHRGASFGVGGRLRTLAAAVLLLAFTAFSPHANTAAHLGGFVAGVGGGLASPGTVMPKAMQGSLVLAGVAILLGAWVLALA